MRSRQDPFVRWVYVLSDICIVEIAWILSFGIRFYLGLPLDKGVPEYSQYLGLMPIIMVVWWSVFFVTDFSQKTGDLKKNSDRMFELIKICQIAMVIFIAVFYFYKEFRYSRGLLIVFAVLHPVLLLIWKSLQRKIYRWWLYKKPKRKILILKASESIEWVGKFLFAHGFDKHSEIHLVDLASAGVHTSDLSHYTLYRRVSVPSTDGWHEFLDREKYFCVVITLHHLWKECSHVPFKIITQSITDVYIASDLAELPKLGLDAEIVRDHLVLSMHHSPLHGSNAWVKRAMDIVGALLAMLIFSPFMFMIPFFIKKSSPGPVFYKQVRMGLDGALFSIYKFRSMPVGAEQQTGAVWSHAFDKRSTKFGSFLRRTSLDELPQLFNVLKGEMSLVGPRPERPIFVHDFRKKIPGYVLRHKVKSGMTGWAQINGWRGNTSIQNRIDCDLFYIQNWSFCLDIKILYLTVLRGFKDPNAY